VKHRSFTQVSRPVKWVRGCALNAFRLLALERWIGVGETSLCSTEKASQNLDFSMFSFSFLGYEKSTI
jgi:hypothetical protein